VEELVEIETFWGDSKPGGNRQVALKSSRRAEDKSVRRHPKKALMRRTTKWPFRVPMEPLITSIYLS
jgi:hypothetical protein